MSAFSSESASSPASPNTASREINSVRMRLNAVNGDTATPYVVIAKKDLGIRVTVRNPKLKTQNVIIFDGERVFMKTSTSKARGHFKNLKDDLAAAIIFNMVTLNPDLELKSRQTNQDAFTTILSEQYLIDIRRGGTAAVRQYGQPSSARLFREDQSDLKLLRSIEYSEFTDVSDASYFHPKRLLYRDHTDDTVSQITLNSVSFNSGVADYIFDLK